MSSTDMSTNCQSFGKTLVFRLMSTKCELPSKHKRFVYKPNEVVGKKYRKSCHTCDHKNHEEWAERIFQNVSQRSGKKKILDFKFKDKTE